MTGRFSFGFSPDVSSSTIFPFAMSVYRYGLPALFFTVLSLSGHAQALTPAVAPPRVFVGLGAGYLSYQMPGRYTVNLPSVVPTVGVMFNPRWSLQVSAAYTGRKDAGSYTVSRFGANGQIANVTVSSATSHRTWAVPLMARYALLPPTQRFQVDLLGGVTLVHDTFRRAATTDSADVRIGNLAESTRKVGVNLTVGVGMRYALTPRLSLAGDAMLTRVLNGSTVSPHFAAPSLVVGLHYSLGHQE